MSRLSNIDPRIFDHHCRWSRTGRDGACLDRCRMRRRGAISGRSSDVNVAVAIGLGRRIVSPGLLDQRQPRPHSVRCARRDRQIPIALAAPSGAHSLAGSFPGGFRTPAPVCEDALARAGIRNPSQGHTSLPSAAAAARPSAATCRGTKHEPDAMPPRADVRGHGCHRRGGPQVQTNRDTDDQTACVFRVCQLTVSRSKLRCTATERSLSGRQTVGLG